MKITRKRFAAAAINTFLLIFIFLLRSCNLLFSIGDAVPMLLLPLCISISMFFGENATLLCFLFAGLLTDSVSAHSSFFNTLFFVIIGVLCGRLASRVLNRNLKSALCLCTAVAFLYFFSMYLIFFAFGGIHVNYDYFVTYLIPSAIYTALWIIPFYFLQKKLS